MQHHSGNFTFRLHKFPLCSASHYMGKKESLEWTDVCSFFYITQFYDETDSFLFHRIFMDFTEKAKHWTVMLLKGVTSSELFKKFNLEFPKFNINCIYICIYLFITGVTIHADNNGCQNHCKKKMDFQMCYGQEKWSWISYVSLQEIPWGDGKVSI